MEGVAKSEGWPDRGMARWEEWPDERNGQIRGVDRLEGLPYKIDGRMEAYN